MKEVGGIWLPDRERHFVDWMTRRNELVDGKLTYQYHKFEHAMEHVRSWRLAVDVGAHVGLWTMHLMKRFKDVWAFEPMKAHSECLASNCRPAPGKSTNLLLLHCALGDRTGDVALTTPTLEDGSADTGGTHVSGAGDIPMRRLDEFELADVDFLKIDCEGYEHHVIAGARETLARCRPCVIVEQKPHKLGPNFGIHGTPAVDALLALGAKVRKIVSDDYVMSWD